MMNSYFPEFHLTKLLMVWQKLVKEPSRLLKKNEPVSVLANLQTQLDDQ
jgi:hypothetical protein